MNAKIFSLMSVKMKIINYVIFLLVKTYFLLSLLSRSTNAASTVTFLEPGSHVHVLPEVGKFGYTIERMNIYCYKGKEKEFSSLLQAVNLNIDIDSDDFSCYSGYSPTDVENSHYSQKSLFSFNLLSRSKKRIIPFNPFNQTCIGLETANEYHVSLNLIRLDLIKLGLLVGGVFVFFSAAKLSRNNAFFYLSGILLGNFASVLVLIWFISKLIPKKPLMYGVLASGWTLAAYFAQILYENVRPILITHQKYVAAYVLIASCISFAVCYYKGPPKNVRSKALIKWGLQILGLLSIFFSSELREAMVGIIVICIVLYYFPQGIFNWFFRIWKRRFPPKRKFISNEEFEEQGRIETEKALKELREYVKSPKCKEQWKLVMNLSHPTRFAAFVEGDEHLTRDETIDYDTTIHAMEFSSDEDTSEEIEESIAVDENFVPISKSRLRQIQNGSLQKNSTRILPQVTSSTPSSFQLRTRQQNGSRVAHNSSFETSDDEENVGKR